MDYKPCSRTKMETMIIANLLYICVAGFGLETEISPNNI